MTGMRDDVELSPSVRGRESMYRRRRPKIDFKLMQLRTERGFGEEENTPKYY